MESLSGIGARWQKEGSVWPEFLQWKFSSSLALLGLSEKVLLEKILLGLVIWTMDSPLQSQKDKEALQDCGNGKSAALFTLETSMV